MISYIKQLHRFIASQSFYPIVFSSVLSVFILSGRMILGHSWSYNNLLWNLFLAWIPYGFSLIAVLLHLAFPRFWLLLIPPGIIWLIFFPNAPYIVTDFLHLHERWPIPLWYDIGLLAMFSWTGCFLAIASLRAMQSLVRYYVGNVVSWLFALTTLALSGLGIYLGRFDRWNSWDALLHPHLVLSDIYTRIINPFNNLRFVGFTLMFTAFLLVSYLMFTTINKIDRQEDAVQEQSEARLKIERRTDQGM